MRTLIVDDEHFVRKGLILTVPWQDYGFEIVGEAENGQRALQQLESQLIDVLITDLTMPKMDGFELMKEVQHLYPQIKIVVLTCHQDFQYAIEAMQYGAIDYLVKTQIEEGKMEEALARIEKRIREDKQREPHNAVKGKEEIPLDLFLFPLVTGASPVHITWEIKPTIIPMEQECYRITEHAYKSWQEIHRIWEANDLYETWIPIISESADTESYYASKDWVKGIIEMIFYAYREDHPTPLVFNVQQSISTNKKLKDQGEMDKIYRLFQSLHWIYDTSLFQTWLQLVDEHQPASKEFRLMVIGFLKAISHLTWIPQKIWRTNTRLEVMCWHELSTMLTQLRDVLQTSSFSEEAAIGIYKAILVMQKDIAENLNQENVAQRVALSRSYFGQCFRPIVGVSFHELLTELRIRKAEELLLTTHDFIYAIAEQAGFKDEKYFSKVFKHHRQVLPTEYRDKHRHSNHR
ncbi:DNA-binding response regulator [Paenibacillus marchantiophytorum]|uniref:DNA-binding response regulator n=1 Tax=Paenibacillus marchantiophytorum TaxID=1619310 RepID=A0ABQ2BV82_9BACL|nr:response regulator [Paenibacillus marchantiophytorum]GGI46583.1 DNA-binding response regulator [Paenibacillus marchantiophytorum]